MKKFFKALMLILAVIPCSLMFVACGPDKDPEKPNDKEANVAALNSALEKVDEVGSNYTQTMKTNSTGIFASNNEGTQSTVTGDNGITRVSKYDGLNFAQDMGDQYLYYIDGVFYVSDPTYTEVNLASTASAEEHFMALEVSVPTAGADVITITKALSGLVDYAFTTNDEAVVATSDGVTIKIELEDTLNTVIDSLTTYREESLETFINSLIEEFTGSTTITVDTLLADLKEWTEETTIEEVVGEDNLTAIKALAGTLVAYIELQKDSIEVEPTIIPEIISENEMAFTSQMASMVLGTISQVSALTVSEVLPMLESYLELEEGTDIFDYVNSFLETNSITDVISAYAGDEVVLMLQSMEIEEATATAKLNLLNNKFVGLDLVIDVDIDIESGHGASMDLEGVLEASFELSEVGTTEIELPENIVVNGLNAYLIKLSDITADNTIVISGIESKVFDLVVTENINLTAISITKVPGAANGEQTFTLTISEEGVEALESNNVLLVAYELQNGNSLMLSFIVDEDVVAE